MKAVGKTIAKVRRVKGPALPDLRITPRSLVEDIKEKLREAIFTGILNPGDRLIESELCRSLNVSRPMLREAIRGLHAERLCEISPNRGAHIPVLSWEDAEQIYYVRSLLEGEAAALCAISITDEDLKELGAMLKEFGEAVVKHDPYQRIEATKQFYGIILRSCGNRIIEEMLLGLIARINFLRAHSMSNPGRSKKSYVEMKAIFDAIKSRNAQQARIMAKAHVEKAKEAAKAVFSASKKPSLERRVVE